MRLSRILAPERVDLILRASDKQGVLRDLAALLALGGCGCDEQTIFQVLFEREVLASTGVGDGVAIPHGRHDRISQVRAAVGICRPGVPFDSIDGSPVRILVAVVAAEDKAPLLLKSLAHVSRVLRDADLRARLLNAGSCSMAFALLTRQEQRFVSIPPPPSRAG